MIALGRCDNHMDNMEYGGLLPKGTRCANRASAVVIYIETINPWTGKPNTQEVSKLCPDCLAYMRKHLRRLKRDRPATKLWPRKIKVIPPEKVKKEHIQALLRSYKRVPEETRKHFGL